MRARLDIQPETWVGMLLDAVMLPFMYLVAWRWSRLPHFEHPQRTHFWNNKKLSAQEAERLDLRLVANVEGDPKAFHTRWVCTGWEKIWVPIFHMPLIGGWREYVVIEAVDHTGPWYIGWIAPDVAGVTRIRRGLWREVRGAMRVLRGPDDVFFFGIDADSGEQINVRVIGSGRVGHGGPYKHLPLR